MQHGLILPGLLPLAAGGTDIRDDALTLFGAAFVAPGIAAHCEERVGPSGEVDRARGAWEQRHEPLMRKVAAVVDSTGGMPESARRKLSQDATALVRREVEAAGGAADLCPKIPGAMDQGTFDLENMVEVRGALARVMLRGE